VIVITATSIPTKFSVPHATGTTKTPLLTLSGTVKTTSELAKNATAYGKRKKPKLNKRATVKL
jgi:hypothetical protein